MDILDKNKDLSYPYMTNELKEKYGLEESYRALNSPDSSEEEKISAIKTLIEFGKNPEIDEYKEKDEFYSLGLKYSLYDSVFKEVADDVYNKNKEILIEKRKNYVVAAKNKNAKNVMDSINKLAESDQIPLKAFENSYKIIGKTLGLTGEKLEEFVKNRLSNSIKKFHQDFDTDNCRGKFAITPLEQLEIGIKVNR